MKSDHELTRTSSVKLTEQLLTIGQLIQLNTLLSMALKYQGQCFYRGDSDHHHHRLNATNPEPRFGWLIYVWRSFVKVQVQVVTTMQLQLVMLMSLE